MDSSESRVRRVLGDSEKRAYVRHQAESGKTLAVFCRDEGIALSSFQSWKKKFSEKSRFIEIAAPAQTRPVPVEVVLASGARVATTSGCDLAWLAELIRMLVAPC